MKDGKDSKQHPASDEQRRHDSGEHGHTGEGAASALAHMISQQGEKQRRENGEATQEAGSGHP